MSDRPEYRTLYATFADDADVHALSGGAFKALVMLKLSLPVIGLGVIYPSKLCDQVGCDRDELEAILTELAAPKPGRDRGWIVRDRNVVWVVNAFACEPGMTPANKNHVKFVRKLVLGVDGRSPVVQEFKDSYRLWFQGDTKPIPKASPRASNASRIPSESHGDPSGHTSTTTQHNKSGDLDQERGIGAPAAPPASAPRFASLAELIASSESVAAWFKTYYARGLADRTRRDDIGRQLLATLNGGAEFRGQRIQAYTLDRLEAKCREVLDEGVRERDKAIVVLLLKLGDTSDGSAPGAIAASTEQQEHRRDAGDMARELVDANAWLEDHADVETAINEQLERDGFPATLADGDVRQSARRLMRESLVLRAYRDRPPDPNTP